MTIAQATDLSAPLLVCVGATGVQGGSVVNALAESDKPYRIRALTRDARKPAAQLLASRGVEIHEVLVSVENVDNVRRAFQGANLAFVMTNFWEHCDGHRETGEGIMMLDAAHAAGANLIIWSGLESISEASHGKYTRASHFDSKAAVTKYAQNAGIPLVNVQPGCYGTFLFNFFRKANDGSYVFSLPLEPSTQIPVLDAAHDYGLFVREAIESPTFRPGSEIFACGEMISLEEIALQFSQITGKKATYQQATDEDTLAFLQSIIPGESAFSFFDGLKFQTGSQYFAGKDTEPSRAHLARPARTWADVVKAHEWDRM